MTLPATRTDISGNPFGTPSSAPAVSYRRRLYLASLRSADGAVTVFDSLGSVINPIVTRHLDKDVTGAPKPSGTIDTLLFTDGLKRVLQTKKDASVDANANGSTQDVMLVSGKVTFDAFGRSIEQYYPLTEPKSAVNNTFNSAVDSIAPTRLEYDVLDRVVKTTLPDNTFTTLAYGFGADRSGLTQFETVVTDANSKVKKTHRDVRNLITSVAEFNQGATLWTSYAYDPLKQITAVTDANNHVTRVSYDHLGRRVSIDNPDTGNTETRYDTASNVVAKITSNLRATGQSVTYAYDFNRLASISYPNNPGNNVTYTYGSAGAPNNSAGRITRLSDAGGSEDRTYGPLGEVVKTIRTLTAEANGASPPPVYTTLYQYDTWNRLLKLTYPDGEVLTYAYDSGGNLTQAQGTKGSYTYGYLNQLTYDKFEQRSSLEAGNGIVSRYSYDPRNRRLANLTTGQGQGQGNRFQNLNYGYDFVGNIASLQNEVPVPPNSQYGGPTQQGFQYDDLYRLTGAQGNYTTAHGLQQYSLAMAYDNIHNITSKQQTDVVNGRTQAKTSYNWLYAYSTPPHAPTHIGQRTYTYDANGNQSGYTDDMNGNRRTNTWDEDNRLLQVEDQGHATRFVYDHAGTRLIKSGEHGTSVYVNSFYTTGTGRTTKQVFAGTTRIAAKVEKNNDGQGPQSPNGVGPIEKDLYFYHPDHLGSSNYVTDRQGRIYEHAEYFPFGETWVLEATNTNTIPYLYTGKELDTETGLYYFGARYYDPRTSVWQSADRILGRYLNGEPNGGVFVPAHLALYSYVTNNPLIYTDPDGAAELYSKSGQYVGSFAPKLDKVFVWPDNGGTALTDTHMTMGQFHTVAATVKGEAAAKTNQAEMSGIAHVIKNKGGKSHKTMYESATFHKGKVYSFFGSTSKTASEFMKDPQASGKRNDAARAGVIDAIINPSDPVGGRTMFEGSSMLGPKETRQPGSNFQEKFVDTGVAHDPQAVGGTTFFQERSAGEAAKWKAAQPND